MVGTYTVKEVNTTIKGYDFNSEQSVTETGATVVKDESVTAELKNEYTKQTGSLELTKTIKGEITEEEAEGALTFEIKTENDKWLAADGSLSDSQVILTLADFDHEEGSKEYTLKIKKLAVGSYTVTETTRTIDGKDVTVTYSVNGNDAEEGTEAAAAIENGKTTKVDFQDDYENHKGNLVIKKSVGGDVTEEEAEGALQCTVTTEITENGKTVTRYLDKDGNLQDEEVILTIGDGFVTEDGGKTYTKTFENVVFTSLTV